MDGIFERLLGKAAAFEASGAAEFDNDRILRVSLSRLRPAPENAQLYSKFGAYTCLNHRGDYEAAAKELLKLGYGQRARKTENAARVLRQTAADCERRYLTALNAGELHLVSLGILVPRPS